MCFISPCQYLVSVPLRMFRLWAFMGMMAQVRLITSTPMININIQLWSTANYCTDIKPIHVLF